MSSTRKLLFLDLEAICDEVDGQKVKYMDIQEIIEIACISMDVQEREVDALFHQFVKPQVYPVLSEFCKKLTNISQTQVNNGIGFPDAILLLTK